MWHKEENYMYKRCSIFSCLFLFLVFLLVSCDLKDTSSESFVNALESAKIDFNSVLAIKKINKSFLVFYDTTINGSIGLGVQEIEYRDNGEWVLTSGEAHSSDDKVTMGLLTGFFGDHNNRKHVLFGYINDNSVKYVKVRTWNTGSTPFVWRI
jgi:hypothetical protein